MSQSPYVLVPPAGPGPSLRNPPFSGAHAAKGSPVSPSNRLPGNTTTTFTAPAHKHAHHLHSIPPREKSTRTLIIDHMLWVHGRTRFAQARAELGMTDRTGGPSSPNYIHRQRPENFEEDEEELSDGEGESTLRARPIVIGSLQSKIEAESRKQDLNLAKSLRLRAESLEKVVTSMLDQPPPIEPKYDDDTRVPNSSRPQPGQHLHTLPNGVRLRLALGTVVNDLFARINYYHQRSSASTLPVLPPALIPLSAIAPMVPNVSTTAEQGLFMPPPPVTDSSGYVSFTVCLN